MHIWIYDIYRHCTALTKQGLKTAAPNGLTSSLCSTSKNSQAMFCAFGLTLQVSSKRTHLTPHLKNWHACPELQELSQIILVCLGRIPS